MDKSEDAFRTISEAAEDLDLPQHVLRFWETRFPQIRPMKRGGGRRYYRPDDVALLRVIRHLLYSEGYTIKGVQRMLKERGVRELLSMLRDGAVAPEAPSADRSAASSPHAFRDDSFTLDPTFSPEFERSSPEAQPADGRRIIAQYSADSSPGGAGAREALESAAQVATSPDTRPLDSAARPEASARSAAWTSAQRERIEAVLAELEECRRILGSAHI